MIDSSADDDNNNKGLKRPFFMPVNILPAAAHDAQVISDLAMRSKAHWGYDEKFMSQVKQELTYQADEINHHPTYLAKLGESIIGFYQLRQVSQSVVELEALFVEPTLIGQGVGGQLFSHAVKQASQLGYQQISIQADPFAQAFYLRQGCITVGTKRSLSITGRQLPLMVYNLD